MSGLRDRVRGIPLATEAYLLTSHWKRRARSNRALTELKSRPLIKLNIGAGGLAGTGDWITIDTAHGCDLYWDLREGIPFAENSIEVIYSSHMFEHLTFTDGQVLLKECLRVLKPGASISLAVPNALMYIEGYLGTRKLPADYFGWQPAFNSTSAIDAVNYVAYMDGEHKYMFDQENLIRILEIAGFANVSERNFDAETDMGERDFESIYAIGFKPN